jgi:hypothetical protein
LSFGKELLELLFGKNFIKKEQNETRSTPPKLKPILDKITHLNSKHQFWHHHMLFPNCIFNKEKGMWNIILEDGGKILSYSSLSKPDAELAVIEKAFYSQE